MTLIDIRRIDRRIWVVLLVTIVLVCIFWLGSRYPQLNEKAAMGGDASLSGLAFDVLIEVRTNSNLVSQIFGNTVNWIFTNWKGMTFGVLFGTCLLTGLSLIKKRSFDRPFADAALGATLGTPLGVCVNCAAPIAQGLSSAGARLETVLAALIASPTLNVIVVSMSFALLPTYMAIIKLVAMLGFILIGIPLLGRFFFAKERAASNQTALNALAENGPVNLPDGFTGGATAVSAGSPPETWMEAVAWVIKAFAGNLWYITKITVPLMLVAGALGSIVISLFPVSMVLDHLDPIKGITLTLVAMVALTATAMFLPVPIAFDVILATVLVHAGMPAKFVVPVLLGLGSFSIYSFMIIGRAISYKVATFMITSLGIIAVASGVLGDYIEELLLRDSLAVDLHILARAAPPTSTRKEVSSGISLASFRNLLNDNEIKHNAFEGKIEHFGNSQVTAKIAHLSPAVSNLPRSGTPFTHFAGKVLGLDQGNHRSDLETFEPYTYYWAIGAGDIHGDGWDDIVMANNAMQGGVSIYANINGKFTQQAIDLGRLEASFVNAVSLVDLNNDGQSDLFISTYFDGAYVFWNKDGEFNASNSVKLPNGNAPMIGAPGFADLDMDGDLDIVAANWSVGTMTSLRNPHLISSKDRIIWNEGGNFEATELAGIPGESLTSLVTDIDGNGFPDILIGDDIAKSDKIYLNFGNRDLRLMAKPNAKVPWLTFSTMSADVGDHNNDLHSDLYVAQIARPQRRATNTHVSVREEICEQQTADKENLANCYRLERERVTAANKPMQRTERCDQIEQPAYRTSCAILGVISTAVHNDNPSLCTTLPKSWRQAVKICEVTLSDRERDAKLRMENAGYLGAIDGRNVLLNGGINNTYSDKTRELQVGTPGWSWNAKFSDLDQDGWLDIFVATGEHFGSERDENVLYHNTGGAGFEQKTVEFGLSDLIPTTAYVLLDYDRDGDVDIVRAPGMTHPIVHRNDHPKGDAFWVILEDEVGNSAGIGSKVILRNRGSKQNNQVREIKASGGFISFDPIKAHFGVGRENSIDTLIVKWLDGEITTVSGPFLPNSELIIRRTATESSLEN